MAVSIGCQRSCAVRNTQSGSVFRTKGVAPVSRAQCRAPTVVVNAVKEGSNLGLAHFGGIPAAVAAACLVFSAPSVAQAATPATEIASAGAELTKNLIESGGTPGAAVPGTNVPFQAPGISQSPRGAPQEQGTNLKQTLKGAGKQIKQNYKDPDAAPFGVGKGPLVREAKRMSQPSFTRSFGNGPSEVYKQSASSSRPIENVRNDPSKVVDNRGVWYPLIEKSAGRS